MCSSRSLPTGLSARSTARLPAREHVQAGGGEWLSEFWVPHRSELLRIDAGQVDRIDAERDYVRLHVGERSYLLLQTIAGLEGKLDPSRFLRIHRSTILSPRPDSRAAARGPRCVERRARRRRGAAYRRTYLRKVKAMAGR
jgi:two-component system response regulator AlgR